MSPCGVRLWSGMNRIDESVGWGADGLGQSPAGVKARCHEQLTDGRSPAIAASVVHACHVQLTPRVIVCIQVSLVHVEGLEPRDPPGELQLDDVAQRDRAPRVSARTSSSSAARAASSIAATKLIDATRSASPSPSTTCSLANVCSRSGPNSTLCSVGIARPATLVGVPLRPKPRAAAGWIASLTPAAARPRRPRPERSPAPPR